MGKTVVADIIVPSIFEKYAIERTAELSAFGNPPLSAKTGLIYIKDKRAAVK